MDIKILTIGNEMKKYANWDGKNRWDGIKRGGVLLSEWRINNCFTSQNL